MIGLKTPLTQAPSGGLATVEDVDYVSSQVRQVLNVRATDDSGALRGEYPWRTEEGSVIDLARHHPLDFLEALTSSFANEAMARWVPDAEFVTVEVERTSRQSGKAGLAWRMKAQPDRQRTATIEV